MIIKPGTGEANTVLTGANLYNGAFNSASQEFDPYVSGYGYIFWLKYPEWVKAEYSNFKDLSERGMKDFNGLSDSTISAAGVQLGFSATEVNYAGGIQMEQGFSITYQVFSGSPLESAFAYWVSGIRDPITNVATYPNYPTNPNKGKYGAKYHSGALMYIATRPDALNPESPAIEFASMYTNVIPTKIPLEHFNYSGGSNETKTFSQEFFGKRHIGKPVMDLAAQVHKTIVTTRGYFNHGNSDNDTYSVATASSGYNKSSSAIVNE